jgi:GTP-binding protein LepA
MVPVLNKIDLPAAEPEKVKEQIEEVIGIDTSNALEISAKTGLGVEDVLEAIVTQLPPPEGDENAPLKALLVDSWYDAYLGVIVLVRVLDGVLKKGATIKMVSTGSSYKIDNVGFFTPKQEMAKELRPGDIGFITASIKQITDCEVGDTITDEKNPCMETLPGFKPSQPAVFCGLYPVDANDFEVLRESLGKLQLNDASFHYEAETSNALGFGFRCGFLGLLHLEIVQERLEREFNLDLLTTSPSVVYKLHTKKGEVQELHNPADMPDPTYVDHMEEPWIHATIMVPDEYVGVVLALCEDKRGVQKSMGFVGNRAMIEYHLPLNEVVYDFYDRLKSCTKGYASFDWHIDHYEESDLVKVGILVNSEPVDALAMILHRGRAESRGRELCSKLKGLIPKQMFKIAIQAAIGGKIIARETVSALRKDVTAKCYGGDISRKRKLLDKQKKGKKKMRMVGDVEIPQSAFLAVLKMDDN